MQVSRLVSALFGVLALLIAIASAVAEERLPLTVAGAGGEHVFQVELARTPEERSKGLMFRREMAPDAGMLFDFGDERVVTMWMKNTYIPLDMLFIGADGEVKTIAGRTTPLSERTISSRTPVRYVLEINGGRAEALGIAAGDRVSGPAFEAVQ